MRTIDTIGSVDDAIEKNEEIIEKLEEYGKTLYELLVYNGYRTIYAKDLNIKYGVSIPSNKREKGEYPIYASNGIAEYINQFNSENTIVFGCRGSIGNVFYCKDKCFILNTAFYIDNYNEYGNLYFALKHENGLKTYASGAAQPQITIENIQYAELKLSKNYSLNKILDYIYYLQIKINKLKKVKQTLLSKYFD